MIKKVKLGEKESFIKNCRDIYYCLVITLGALLLSMPVNLINKFVTNDIDKGVVYSSIMYVIELGLHCAAVYFLCLFFKKMSENGKPFSTEIASKIKSVSRSLLWGGAVYMVALAVICLIEPKGTVEALTDANAETGIGYMFAGSVIYSLAYVFSHGAKLQQESDDTV